MIQFRELAGIGVVVRGVIFWEGQVGLRLVLGNHKRLKTKSKKITDIKHIRIISHTKMHTELYFKYAPVFWNRFLVEWRNRLDSEVFSFRSFRCAGLLSPVRIGWCRSSCTKTPTALWTSCLHQHCNHRKYCLSFFPSILKHCGMQFSCN